MVVAEQVGFEVQKRQCATCIYRKDSPLDLKKLEAQIADPHGGFVGIGSATTRRQHAVTGSGAVTAINFRWAKSRSGWEW